MKCDALTVMQNDILKKLRDHQVSPVEHLLSVFKTFKSAVDLSFTGTGKTYVASAVAASLNIPTLVVCPAIAQTAWKTAAKHFDTEFSVVSYDKLRLGHSGFGQWKNQALVDEGRQPFFVCDCCQLKVDLFGPNYFPCYTVSHGIHCVRAKKEEICYGEFIFHPAIRFLIFDEGHRCGGLGTLNGDTLIAAKRQQIPTLLLSATAACSPLNLRALGYLLDLHTLTPRGGLGFYDWARKYGCRRDDKFGGGFKWMVGKERQDAIMAEIHRKIIPARGVSVQTKDIPGFPERIVRAESYDLDEAGQIQALYEEMAEALTELHERTSGYADGPLQRVLSARQKIELLKVPIVLSLSEDDLAKGYSVCIFASFRATLDEIQRRWGGPGEVDIIDGRTVGAERDEAIARYQSNDRRRLLLNSLAGGICISLQDLTGFHPRVGNVFPDPSAVVMQQVFGRLPRDGGKSPALYRVLFAAGTWEDSMARSLRNKADCIELLNDADCEPENFRLTKASRFNTI